MLLLLARGSLAAPTGAVQVRKAAQGWLKLDAKPLGADLGSKVRSVETFTDSQGQPVYHVVYLDPKGYLIVSADDDVEPIVAFVNGEDYDPSPDNPLRQMVESDLPARVAAARMAAAAPAGGQAPTGQAGLDRSGQRQAHGKWQRLSAAQDDALSPPTGSTSISDVRVAPLTQSRWDQSSVCSGSCYNYYTPNHDVCGCTATAFAQLLRFYQYPTAAIGANASTIYVDGVSQTAYTRGGDGTGGPYNWSQMPLVPDCSLTTAQRQAIGSLTSDAGVLVHMQYTSGSSGAWVHDCTYALRGALGYGNAITGYAYSDAPRNQMLNPSLDAGHPCLLAIYNDTVGHAVVVDGYGYNVDTLYHHLNMGWSGNSDAWYNLPHVDCSYNFTYITECVYNVFVSGTGEIISGRVTDKVGHPVPGATVNVQQVGGGTWSVTCNSKSMYVLDQVPSNTSFILTPSAPDYTFAGQTITTGTSTDYGTTGNRWVDLSGTPNWPDMSVTPTTGLISSGSRGSYTPANITFTITNIGGQSMDWTAGCAATWLALSKTSGTLAPGQADTVVASISDGAYPLSCGRYSDAITFTNTTDGHGSTTRGVSLRIAIATGDVNGDSRVDAMDLTGLAGAWGSTSGDATYNTTCDFNHNGNVNVVDLLLLADNWGKSAAVSSVAGGLDHSIRLESNGEVSVCGKDNYGQLGDGGGAQQNSPIKVASLSTVAALASGFNHNLAVGSGGAVWVWGDNSYGQLGDGTTAQQNTPKQVPGLTGIVAVAAGHYHSLAVAGDGTVWAWGRNNNGQLGDGTTTQRNSPVQIPGLSGVAAVAAGDAHSVALKTDGTVWAWGLNLFGQVGDGTTTQRNSPVQVSQLSSVTAVAAGGCHCLAVKNDGTVWAWGWNSNGQLGDGTMTQRTTAARILTISGAVGVAAGYTHSLAVINDGSVWAWGFNASGQLGDGTTSQRLNPVLLSGISGVAAIGAGHDHSLAIKTDGTVWAWGKNASGQLGDGTTTQRAAPVQIAF